MGPGRAFRRVGRALQFRIVRTRHLAAAVKLDSALWVATGAPVAGINLDGQFLKLVDTDHNGRIMTEEVRRAIRWILEKSASPGGIETGSATFSMSDIAESAADLRSALGKVLKARDGTTIDLPQIRDLLSDASAREVSDEGVVSPSAKTIDEEMKEYLRVVVAVTGGTTHPSGTQGASEDDGAEFHSRADGYLAWREEMGDGDMPFGARTPAVYKAVMSLAPKMAQYFALCHAASLSLVPAAPPEGFAFDLDDTGLIEARLRKEPIARPRRSGVLPLDEAPNPYYRKDLDTLRAIAAEAPLPFAEGLSEDSWDGLVQSLSAYRAWAERKPDGGLESVQESALRKYRGPEFLARLRELATLASKSVITVADLRLLEKFALFQANILRLANNFVSFPDLYDPDRRAVFEMGTLVADGRHFCFTARVRDLAAHQKLAAASSMFVCYANIFDLPAAEGAVRTVKYTVAVPVTSGTAGNLVVGKRGVFYDLTGTEWDAEIVALQVNPVSIREALTLPFRRLSAALGSRIDTLATEAQTQLNSAAAGAVTVDPTALAAPASAPSGGANSMGAISGLVAGGGVAIAALGSAFAYLTSTLSSIPWWHILIGVGGAFLAVLVPTFLSALRKIRRRDLSAIMEASGWAVNARMRLSRHQSRTFTFRPSPRTEV